MTKICITHISPNLTILTSSRAVRTPRLGLSLFRKENFL